MRLQHEREDNRMHLGKGLSLPSLLLPCASQCDSGTGCEEEEEKVAGWFFLSLPKPLPKAWGRTGRGGHVAGFFSLER